MTSFTKPEVHNVLHCRQKSTEQRPHVTRTENVVTFRHVVFEARERTDRQTDRHADGDTSPTYRGEVTAVSREMADMETILHRRISVCVPRTQQRQSHVHLWDTGYMRRGEIVLTAHFVRTTNLIDRHCHCQHLTTVSSTAWFALPVGFTARRYASAVCFMFPCPSVCVSVRPSVTSWCCIIKKNNAS